MGVSRESVRLWTQAGCPRRDDGSFIVAEVVSWRIRRAVDEEKKRAKDSTGGKPTELNRKLAVEADLKELQLEKERGNSIPNDVHQQIVQRIVGGFAAVAAGRLQRFERAIVQAVKAADARILTRKIHVALMEGAQGLGDELDEEAADAEVEDAKDVTK